MNSPYRLMYSLVEVVVLTEHQEHYESHVDVVRVTLLGRVQDA